MRHTFVTPLSFALIASSWAKALHPRDSQICTTDAVYKAMWHNSEINHDASTYCLTSVLSEFATTTCEVTTTNYFTEMPSANVTYTVTSMTTVPAVTVYNTTTELAFAMPTTTTAQPGMTARAVYVPSKIADIVRRQTASSGSADLTASIVSACQCGHPARETSYTICASNTTIYNTVDFETTVTIVQTVSSGTTTIQTAVNQTTTLPVSSTTSSAPISAMPSSSGNGSPSMTISSTIVDPTFVPGECPANNGTIFSSNTQTCTQYLRVCYRSYADSDFDNIRVNYDTPQGCTQLCDARNGAVSGSCLGAVFNNEVASGVNCRLLKSTMYPVADVNTTAYLLQMNDNCNNNGTMNTTSMTTTSTPMSTNITSSTMSTVDSSTTDMPSNSTIMPTNSSSTPWDSTIVGPMSTGPSNTTSDCSPTTTITYFPGGWNDSWSGWGSDMMTSTVYSTVTVNGNSDNTTAPCNASVVFITATYTMYNNFTFTNSYTDTVTTASVSTATVTSCPGWGRHRNGNGNGW